MSGNIAWVHKRRPRRITKLSVHSVDSVDRGAGVGCNVMIMKRDQTQEGPMSLRETIQKSFELRARGQLSDFDLAIAHQRRAAELGKSLAQYYASDEGRAALNIGVATKRYSDQVSSAYGDGYRVAKGMADREEPYDKTPHVSRASADNDDADGQVARQIQGMVLQLMQKNPGLSADQAHLHIASTPEGKALLSRAHNHAVSKNMR
jgi:hypothetical protein